MGEFVRERGQLVKIMKRDDMIICRFVNLCVLMFLMIFILKLKIKT